ncbi:MAG: DNA polymerase Y family protein [Polyangiales bacterium]
MGRLACVDLPSFPLQLLQRGHADWRGHGVVLVDRDHPQGLILSVNERAHRRGVRPGMRYGVALGLDGDLRAGEISPEALTTITEKLLTLLVRFSPVVEPNRDEPGVFWLDVDGLSHLYPSLDDWATAVWEALHAEELAASVVVGFRRFATYAIAKSYRGNGIVVFANTKDEDAASKRVPLRHLTLSAEAHALLEKLHVHTVEAFLKLPSAGILRRFGPEAHRIHRLAHGDGLDRVHGRRPTETITFSLVLDEPETVAERLLFLCKQGLDPMLARLAKRTEALGTLEVSLHARRRPPERLRIRPAVPSLDGAQILNLLQLRLETVSLEDGITELRLRADGLPASREQLALFAERPNRDLDAAARAFARLRALFGEHAVCVATPEAGHLPEATFSWKPLETLPAAQPTKTHALTLVRRMLREPEKLPPSPLVHPEGWLIRGVEHGPVIKATGPYVMSGGWWRSEIQRDYYFTELHSGEWLWVYYDRKRRRWFLQGHVA